MKPEHISKLLDHGDVTSALRTHCAGFPVYLFTRVRKIDILMDPVFSPEHCEALKEFIYSAIEQGYAITMDDLTQVRILDGKREVLYTKNVQHKKGDKLVQEGNGPGCIMM